MLSFQARRQPPPRPPEHWALERHQTLRLWDRTQPPHQVVTEDPARAAPLAQPSQFPKPGTWGSQGRPGVGRAGLWATKLQPHWERQVRPPTTWETQPYLPAMPNPAQGPQ